MRNLFKELMEGFYSMQASRSPRPAKNWDITVGLIGPNDCLLAEEAAEEFTDAIIEIAEERGLSVVMTCAPSED